MAQLRTLLLDRTVILPSNNTSSDVEWRGPSWFVMGAGNSRVACELVAQLRADGRKNPLLLVNTRDRTTPSPGTCSSPMGSR